jgi:PTH1 family peptidyl-tRNA hydrolase
MTTASIRLIVGLGNPGPKYEETRHNAGFWFVDRLASRHGGSFRTEARFHGLVASIVLDGCECRLLKPGTFMNRSGQSVSSLCHYFKIPPQQILLAHDELDLPAGVARFKLGGGHAGHNGLRDTMAALGSRDFYRLRIGIDHPQDRGKVVDYVLSRPSRIDAQAIDQALEVAADALPDLLAGDLQKAMNRLHGTRP